MLWQKRGKVQVFTQQETFSMEENDVFIIPPLHSFRVEVTRNRVALLLY